MTTRPATLDDYEELMRLYTHLHADDQPLDESFGRKELATIIDRSGLELLVLEHEGRLVATIYLNIIPNLTRAGRPYAVIENVVVDSLARQQGFGRQIMDATLEKAWAAGCYKVMLMTGVTNPNSHGFYRACGFSSDAKTAYLIRHP